MNNRELLSGAAAVAPTAPVAPSAGYPTGGNPSTVTAPSVIGPYWFHQIGEELRNVVVAGGLTPNSGNLTQLLTAIQTLVSGAITPIYPAGPGPFTPTNAVGFRLPGGWKLLWATVVFGDVSGGSTVTVALPDGGYTTNCVWAIPVIEMAPGAVDNLSAAVVSRSATSVDVQLQEWSAAVNPGTLRLIALGF